MRGQQGVHRLAIDVSVRTRKQQRDNHLLTLDAAKEKDLKDCDDSDDSVFMKNEEGGKPAVSESMVTCKSQLLVSMS
jgi:hypothetical protein